MYIQLKCMHTCMSYCIHDLIQKEHIKPCIKSSIMNLCQSSCMRSTHVTYKVHLCTLTFALPAASPFSVSRILETYEHEFLKVVDPKLSLLKLKYKGVISANVRTTIESANDEDAKYVLLEHLQKNATVDTLRVYCDVAIAANGFPRMQELGKKIKDALPPEGWSDLWL